MLSSNKNSKKLNNYALNKITYPLYVIYARREYNSLIQKFANIIVFDLCYVLYAFQFIILIGII